MPRDVRRPSPAEKTAVHRTTTCLRATSTKAKGRSAVTTNTNKPECPICLELFHEPVTTRCGHTFCFHCLFLSPIRECPMCRCGPLLVERGDFAEDALMALRVKVERSCPPPMTTVMSSLLRQPTNDYGKRQPAPNAPNAGRKVHLQPVEALLTAYHAYMARWWAQYSDRMRAALGVGTNSDEEPPPPRHNNQLPSTVPLAIVDSPAFATASLATRAHLGRQLRSHYTFDENLQQQMFFEGGFMWRRAPSIAIQRREVEEDIVSGGGDGHVRNNTTGGAVTVNRRSAALRRSTSASLAAGTTEGDDSPSSPTSYSHIDHLLSLERRRSMEKDASQAARACGDRHSLPVVVAPNVGSARGGTLVPLTAGKGRSVPVPETTEAAVAPNRRSDLPPQPHTSDHNPPLPPIMVTPRGKVWTTAAVPAGAVTLLPTEPSALLPQQRCAETLTVVDVCRFQRQRPQSAAELKEDAQMVADTRAYLKLASQQHSSRQKPIPSGLTAVGLGRPPLVR